MPILQSVFAYRLDGFLGHEKRGWGKMKKRKSPLLRLVKETPASRKTRISSGIRLRSAVFEDRKKKYLNRLRLFEGIKQEREKDD